MKMTRFFFKFIFSLFLGLFVYSFFWLKSGKNVPSTCNFCT